MKKFLSIFLVFSCLFCMNLCCFAESQSYDGIVTRRALVMSATYDYLVNGNGFVGYASLNCMRNAFEMNNIDTFTYEHPTNSTSTQFLNKIMYYLSSADDDDVSYVFICAHGDSNGNLYVNGGSNYDCVSLSDLKSILDTIDGKIVLMINSCYSGNAIDDGRNNLSDSNRSQKIIKTFLGASEGEMRSGEFYNSRKYIVFCSSLSTEMSWSSSGLGYAVHTWAEALGYIVTNVSTGNGYSCFLNSYYRPADFDSNELLTAIEFASYDGGYIGNNQHMAYYSYSPYYTIVTDDYMLGDVTLDGGIYTSDLLALRKHIAGIQLLTGRARALADVNSDGTIDNADVLALSNLVAM